jgi:hypothetical protein
VAELTTVDEPDSDTTLWTDLDLVPDCDTTPTGDFVPDTDATDDADTEAPFDKLPVPDTDGATTAGEPETDPEPEKLCPGAATMYM